MNPNTIPPQDPREQMEVRIVAWLLGEASEFEAAQLQEAIEKDPQLAAFHNQLRQTIDLAAKAAQPAATQTATDQLEKKLSAKRRETLFAQFKVAKERVPLRANLPIRRFQFRFAVAAGIAILVLGLWAYIAFNGSRKELGIAKLHVEPESESGEIMYDRGSQQSESLATRVQVRSKTGSDADPSLAPEEQRSEERKVANKDRDYLLAPGPVLPPLDTGGMPSENPPPIIAQVESATSNQQSTEGLGMQSGAAPASEHRLAARNLSATDALSQYSKAAIPDSTTPAQKNTGVYLPSGADVLTDLSTIVETKDRTLAESRIAGADERFRNPPSFGEPGSGGRDSTLSGPVAAAGIVTSTGPVPGDRNGGGVMGGKFAAGAGFGGGGAGGGGGLGGVAGGLNQFDPLSTAQTRYGVSAPMTAFGRGEAEHAGVASVNGAQTRDYAYWGARARENAPAHFGNYFADIPVPQTEQAPAASWYLGFALPAETASLRQPNSDFDPLSKDKQVRDTTVAFGLGDFKTPAGGEKAQRTDLYLDSSGVRGFSQPLPPANRPAVVPQSEMAQLARGGDGLERLIEVESAERDKRAGVRQRSEETRERSVEQQLQTLAKAPAKKITFDESKRLAERESIPAPQGSTTESAGRVVGQPVTSPAPENAAEGISVGKQFEARKTEDAPQSKPAPIAPAQPQPEISTRENRFSTFSLNVSDVSFRLAAASLANNIMPEPGSIRVEEFLNAFDYHDCAPAPGARLGFQWERARSPFAHNRDVLRIGIQTAAIGREADKPLNLVVLLDNSGSMERPDRVQVVRTALQVLARRLQPHDRISVVTFSRTPRLVVDGLEGGKPGELLARILNLNPEGGTNLEEALKAGYETAARHYVAKGMNRVILLTDGAANLGNIDAEQLKKRVVAQRAKGIALDCFGIGWDGYNDELLEALSRNGDGRYGFLNDPAQAEPDFANQLAGALSVAAADVKTQIEFNPARVTTYRQIGYARHQLTKEQFRDNTVDAAEIAAAESGNALYAIEVNPQGSGPIGVVRVRYKIPGTGSYVEQAWPLAYTATAPALDQASPAMRLAATAAAFGEWLERNPYVGDISLGALRNLLEGLPEHFAPDPRPSQLSVMIQQAQAITGK
ncbi:MAG: von Willebrand factor type A domain-containing protein [Verrucomicrobiota bacterium]